LYLPDGGHFSQPVLHIVALETLPHDSEVVAGEGDVVER
jgi:hypothetical protein